MRDRETNKRDIVMAGYAGETAAVICARESRELLKQKFREDYVEKMTEYYDCSCDIEDIGKRLIDMGIGIVTDIEADKTSDIIPTFAAMAPHAYVRTIGVYGVLPELYETAQLFGCGCRIEKRKIPVRQTSVEVCELTGTDPYRSEGRGCLIVCGADLKGELLEQELRKKGIPAGCIGYLCDGHDKLVVDDPERVEFINRR